jgi:hypothetical protein
VLYTHCTVYIIIACMRQSSEWGLRCALRFVLRQAGPSLLPLARSWWHRTTACCRSSMAKAEELGTLGPEFLSLRLSLNS